MAKGLFSVYVDPTSSASTSFTTPTIPKPRSKSGGLKNNKSSNVIESGNKGWNGKENFDPFADTNMKDLMSCAENGKSKKKYFGGSVKKVGSTTTVETTTLDATTTTSSRPVPRPISIPPISTGADGNDICTGLLRTRLAPSPTSLSSDLLNLPRRTGTPHSAKDSGYCRSDNEESDEELNRRARGLTESPLAEITQAFSPNGSGAFSLPSPTSHSHSHSPLAKAHPLRKVSPPRNALTKEKEKKGAPLAKPYEVSKTMTTRKRKDVSSSIAKAALRV